MVALEILFVRMSATLVASLIYMWLAKVPDAPFGKKEVRKLLIVRGVGGFFGSRSCAQTLSFRADPFVLIPSKQYLACCVREAHANHQPALMP